MFFLVLLLFFLPFFGPLIAGLVGGRKAGNFANAILAAMLPSFCIALVLLSFSSTVSSLPLIGAIASWGSLVVAFSGSAPMLIGAVIGGLLIPGSEKGRTSRPAAALVLLVSAILTWNIYEQVRSTTRALDTVSGAIDTVVRPQERGQSQADRQRTAERQGSRHLAEDTRRTQAAIPTHAETSNDADRLIKEAQARRNLQRGLVAHYELDGDGRDSSGSGAHADIVGATPTTGVDGQPRSALHFDGRSYIASSPGLPVGNAPRSVSLWFRTSSTSGSGGWQWNTLFCFGALANSRLYMAGIYAGHIAFGGWANDDVGDKHPFVADNQWHHLVVAHDGRTHSLWLDNELVISRSTTFDTTRSQFFIGRRIREENQYMNGDIDAVRIYDRALDDHEVATLFASRS
ncbi:MAG: LamG domain-containing protein [Xanthomonadales bacterium]|nr:LamG domain-containing protein [Xanthomonadales bacterium]